MYPCVFLCFSLGQPVFLSLWHTQQSFLLNTMGELTRQHNGYHLGIMWTGSLKWSYRAWQVKTMGKSWAPEKQQEHIKENNNVVSVSIIPPINKFEFWKKFERIDYPMWFVLNDISSSLKTFVDSCTRLRNFWNTMKAGWRFAMYYVISTDSTLIFSDSQWIVKKISLQQSKICFFLTHTFFFIVKTWHQFDPQCNSTSYMLCS